MSVKITELPILSELADNDVIAGVDVSGNVTSKIEMETLKDYIDTNTQYTAGTNIDITDNVISAPNVPTKEEFDSLSTIFNAFPTESDEDESMTLDGTAEVKFKKFDLKGNTSQTTYSGKNLLINTRDEGYTVTSNGITFKVNKDKSITVTGTATNVASMSLNLGTPVTLSAGTYTLSKKETTDVQVAIWYDSASVWTAVRGDKTAIQKTISENTTFNNWRTLVVVYQGVTVNTTVYPMLEKSSTETSYEPYVGGNPSPNPSSPIPVNVVSGDNEINIWGKNICFTDFGDWESGEYNSSGNKGNNTSRVRTKDLLIVRQSTTYYFDTSSSNDSFIVREYDKNKTFIKSDGIIANGGTITTMSSCYFLGITLFSNTNQTRSYDTYQTLFEESTIKPFICLNSVSNKTFEPYIGNTYNINLPVENLWGGFSNSFTRTDLGVQFTANQDGTITANGTATNVATSILLSEATSNGIYKTLQKGTYTVSGGGAKYNVEIYDKNNVVRLGGIDVNGSKVSFTINEETQIVLRIQVASGVTINETIKLQLEAGDKANTYTPYGTTPIELCKIGNYQDYFYKDSGKWYLHKEIGKVVLDGSERGWGRSGSSSNDVFVGALNLNQYGIGIYSKQSTASSWLVNRFSYGTLGTLNKFNVYNPDATYGYNNIGFGISTDIVNDIDTFKTWVSSNNIVFHYLLATPTNTEITYQPLIEQLNAIKLATSKQGQTNISQVNNDLGFIIYAEAIKSLENVLDRLALVEE